MSVAAPVGVPWHADARRHLRSCGDPVIAALAERLPPLVLDLDTRYFQRLVAAIVGQQISGHAARAIMGLARTGSSASNGG